jgi:Glycosyl hydrolase family 57
LAAEPHAASEQDRVLGYASSPLAAPARPLLLVCLFHLNLAFSSLEEESRAEVVRRCYWPALELVERTGFPIAIEATGWTVRRIAELDPAWLARARELLATGHLELVGSAHAQCAAPLLPAQVNAWNLRLGREVYAELLGVAPRVALVCEQVFSPGLVPLYLQAGYETIVVDWDNAYRSHPEWPRERRHLPQRARGGGSTIPLLWSESIAFQKFQRFAHGELALERYLDYVRGVAASACARNTTDSGRDAGALMLYANDAEIFDHRPGRFPAEPDLEGDGEWLRIAECLEALREHGVGVPALPTEVLDLLDAAGAGEELSLEAPDQPISVKKQDKYNVTRWAVTGRDDVGVNTRCWRLYDRIRSSGCTDANVWRELCELWASDFRTHITESRWRAFLVRLEDAEQQWLRAAPADRPSPPAMGPPGIESDMGEPPAGAVSTAHDALELRAGSLALRVNTRRGMAIEAFSDARIGELPLLGTLEHGYFSTIELGADFYSGHLVQESPLTHKLTDLERVQPRVGVDGRGRVGAWARIATERGAIEKAIRLDPETSTVELEWTLLWQALPAGVLRLGHVTLLPEAFDVETLWYATHDGGHELEVHRVAGHAFDHGAPVSALVSCHQGLGVTEGVVLLGDAERTIRVQVDQACARPLGLVSWTPAGEHWLLRLCFTLSESDETRRGEIPRDADAPQRMRLRISAERTRPDPRMQDAQAPHHSALDASQQGRSDAR